MAGKLAASSDSSRPSLALNCCRYPARFRGSLTRARVDPMSRIAALSLFLEDAKAAIDELKALRKLSLEVAHARAELDATPLAAGTDFGKLERGWRKLLFGDRWVNHLPRLRQILEGGDWAPTPFLEIMDAALQQQWSTVSLRRFVIEGVGCINGVRLVLGTYQHFFDTKVGLLLQDRSRSLLDEDPDAR